MISKTNFMTIQQHAKFSTSTESPDFFQTLHSIFTEMNTKGKEHVQTNNHSSFKWLVKTLEREERGEECPYTICMNI